MSGRFRDGLLRKDRKMIDIGKLTKHDLLLMLRDQEIELRQLRAENEKLRARPAGQAAQSAPREIGSIAEEAIKVSGVLIAAQKAAEEYLEGVKARYESLEGETNRVIEETKARCSRLESESRQKADLAWDSVKKKLDDYCAAHAELEGLLGQTQSIVNQLK